MAYTTVAEVQDTIDTIHEKALVISQQEAIMAGLSWNIAKGKGRSTVDIPYFHIVSANTLTEGVDMIQTETMEDTNVSISLNEVGCKIVLTDNAIEDDKETLQSIAGKVLGEAVATKQDTDLLGQFADAASTLAGINTTLTMGHIAAAKALLAGNAASAGGKAPMPYVVVLHPFMTLDLVDVMTPVVAGTSAATSGWQAIGTAFSDEIVRNYTVGRLFGMNVLEDANITCDTADDGSGGVFSMGEGGALVLATARSWEVRPERDESLRGWELNCVGRYGVGEYEDAWMVRLLCDMATPA